MDLELWMWVAFAGFVALSFFMAVFFAAFAAIAAFTSSRACFSIAALVMPRWSITSSHLCFRFQPCFTSRGQKPASVKFWPGKLKPGLPPFS